MKLRLFPVFPFAVIMMAMANVWSDYADGRSVDWANLAMAAGMILFSSMIYLICWGILREAEQNDERSEP